MRDQCAAVLDDGVHATEGVLPVGVVEFGETGEGLGHHLLRVLPGFVVQVAGVDQARGVDLHGHAVSSTSRRPGPRRSRPVPVQPDVLARPELGGAVGVGIGQHTDHRVSAGDRMVGTQQHGLAVGRHLDRTAGGALARQLPVRLPVHQRRADQPHPDPVAAIGGHPVGVDQGVGIGEPVVARGPGTTRSSSRSAVIAATGA